MASEPFIFSSALGPTVTINIYETVSLKLVLKIHHPQRCVYVCDFLFNSSVNATFDILHLVNSYRKRMQQVYTTRINSRDKSTFINPKLNFIKRNWRHKHARLFRHTLPVIIVLYFMLSTGNCRQLRTVLQIYMFMRNERFVGTLSMFSVRGAGHANRCSLSRPPYALWQ